MTNDNLYATVRLPLNRQGTIIRVHESPGDMPPTYDVQSDEGKTVTMVTISQGSLIPKEDYDRLIAMVRGIRDGTIKTTSWTADHYLRWLMGGS